MSDAPTFLFVRPLDPLREIAGATGGEVGTTQDYFPGARSSFHAVAITYRMDRPPDGSAHSWTPATRREGTLRTASSVAGAPELAAAAQSGPASKPGAAGTLPVQIFVALLEVKKNKRLVGSPGVGRSRLIAEALEKSGRAASASLSLSKRRDAAVRPSRGDGPVAGGHGHDLAYVFPLEWPPEAQRVAVTVEELKTGARGTAAADLPKPE